ncbi:MAG: autotransporter outer membrane beta-barrel domain-containing protein [Proteobacteria bacterium]|nr:autotransporter outer membrane beta-barrel domain-containing protein [Pseudomonadota bacterium]
MDSKRTFTRKLLAYVPGVVAMLLTAPLLAVDLGEVDTDNEVQTATGSYIDIICPKMAGIQPQLSEAQTRLFRRCGGAKFNQEGEGFELGETADVLQRLSPEESLTAGSSRTDTALKNQIETRFSNLRAGVSGVSIGGVQWSDQTGGTAGADDFSRWGFFLNGVYDTGDKDAEENENQFDFDGYGITTGIDYRLSNHLVAGIAYSYVDTDADINDRKGAVSSTGTGAGKGEQSSESNTVALYGTYFDNNFYIDGSFGYSSIDLEGERSIQYGLVDQIALMDTDAEQITFSLGGGFNQQLGGAWNARYYARLDYVDVEIDGYRETSKETTAAGSDPLDAAADKDSLIMAIGDQDIESLQSVLGLDFTYVMSTDFGVFTPYARAQWHHEFKDDSRRITAKYIFDPTDDIMRFRSNAADEDFFGISLGVSSVLREGMQIFANYDTVLGLDNVSHHIFTAGFRIEF